MARWAWRCTQLAYLCQNEFPEQGCYQPAEQTHQRSLHRLGLLEQSAIHLLLCSTTFMQQRTVPRTVRLLHLLMIDASKLKHIVTAASSKLMF